MTIPTARHSCRKLSGSSIRMALISAWVLVAVILSGCGNGIAGTYAADARLLEGREDLMEPGYSLSEIQARIGGGKRKLTLLRNGRYEWRTGGEGLNEGIWRVDGKRLILRDDRVGGIPISSALQQDRVWEIRPNGEIVGTGNYNAYNIEEFYTLNGN